jgi:hypothetical protein
MTQAQSDVVNTRTITPPFKSSWCHCGLETRKTQCVFIRGFWVYDLPLLGVKFRSLLKLPAQDNPPLIIKVILAMMPRLEQNTDTFNRLAPSEEGQHDHISMDDSGDELWSNSPCVRGTLFILTWARF